ncbi:MAG: U32 family peptidase, partial [Thermodesulfovibrionaceae bacterium]
RYNQRGKGIVKEFYGSIETRVFASISFGSGVEHAKCENAIEFIKRAQKYGIDVYLNVNNLKATPDFIERNKTQILDFLRKAEDIGVKGVIFAAVPLIEFTAQQNTSLRIVASAILQIDTLQKIKRYKDMGVHRIILSLFKGRDFDFLEKLKMFPDMEWEILCNEICRFECPFLPQHYLHRSNFDFAQDKTKNYYYKFCYKELLEDFPINILKTRFIRPEDVPFYHEKFGIQYFKIVRRESHPELISHFMKAYTSFDYDGNLMHLFPMFTKNPEQLKREGGFYIRNKDLDGFLEYFYTNRPDCSNDCFSVDGSCDYCKRIAKNLISSKNLISTKTEGD